MNSSGTQVIKVNNDNGSVSQGSWQHSATARSNSVSGNSQKATGGQRFLKRIRHQQRRVGVRLQALVVTQQLKLTALAFAGAVILLPLAGCGPNDAAGESVEAQDLDAWGVNMEKCLEEKGWTIELTPDGGMNTVIPKGQDTSYSADYDACEASFGYDVTPDYSDEQVREIYEQVVVTAECLNEQGHDPGAPPSEQTFVEQVQSGPGGWDPYSGLYPAMMDQEEYYAALESCPRTWH